MIYRHARLFPKLARAAVGTSRSGAPTLKALTSNSSSPAPTSRKEVCLLGVLGTFSGCIGPLVGVGGGIISIPIWREFTTLPQKYLSATSLVAVGVSACAASVAFVQAGQVNFWAAGSSPPGSNLNPTHFFPRALFFSFAFATHSSRFHSFPFHRSLVLLQRPCHSARPTSQPRAPN